MNVDLTQAASLATTLFADGQAPTAPAGSGPFSIVVMVFVFLIAMFFLFVLPNKSRDKKMQKMYDSIKQNDKVLTYGGVIGTVYSIDREQGEIVLKVDDNVKIHFALSSVYFVYDKDANAKAKK